MDTEWLMLADSAQVISNKLFLLGGGWDVLTNTSGVYPLNHPCSIVISLKVPWSETNQRHNIEAEILTEDGQSLFKMQGQCEVGRPPGMPPVAQRLHLAQNILLQIPREGTYVLVARIEGQEIKRSTFRVLQVAQSFQQMPG